MKLLIINPNSNADFSGSIEKIARHYAAEGTELICLSAPGAPMFIENYRDDFLCAPGMVELLNQNEKDYDAFIVACTCDVNIDILREMTDKPVLGIGESSMLAALLLGEKFSVIQTTKHSVEMKELMVRKLGLDVRCSSVRSIDESGSGEMEEKIRDAARTAVEEDGASVIALGCAGFPGLAKMIEKDLGVPVVDGVPVAVKMAEGLVSCGLRTSKKGRFCPQV